MAVLNRGSTVPIVQEARRQYHDVLAATIQPTIDRYNARAGDDMALKVLGFDTVKDVHPGSLDGIDAIFISGSSNGVYKPLPWIQKLIKYVSELYKSHPNIKLYGSCFGHQVLCEALYRERGVVVCKDPNGYELSVQTVELDWSFAHRLQPYSGERKLRLQILHGDHVMLLEGISQLPQGVSVVGATSHCNVQGIYEAGRILTFQGHPKFDTFISSECLKLVEKRVGWDDAYAEAAVVSAQAEDDAAAASDIIVAFFLGKDNV